MPMLVVCVLLFSPLYPTTMPFPCVLHYVMGLPVVRTAKRNTRALELLGPRIGQVR